jgi:nickel superoxide dismutase
MKNLAIACLVISAITFSSYHVVYSHCEIPCGIYGDKTRITILLEDITTIEKSMTEINRLQALEKPKPVDVNQMVRWVNNKEEHANKIQHIVTQYFMTQRVKKDKPNYVKQLTALHGLLVHAMKAKQTVDVAHVEHLRKLVDTFASVYFSPEDLKHLKDHK